MTPVYTVKPIAHISAQTCLLFQTQALRYAHQFLFMCLHKIA